MVDIANLQAVSQKARISCEMARTRLSSAKVVLAERQERYARLRARQRIRELRSLDAPSADDARGRG